MFILFILISQVVSLVINTGLGALVLRANSRGIMNRLYAVFAFSVALWNFSLLLTIINAPAQLVWSRLAFSFGVVMFSSLFYFSLIFPGDRRVSRRISIPLFVVSALLFVGTLTPFMVKSVTVIGGHITGELGPVLQFFTLFVIFLMISSFVVFLKKFLSAKGVLRVQLTYINFGVGFFVLTFLTTNLFLPVFFGIFDFNNLGPVFSFVMNIAIAYAIVQYHLMDVEILLRRGTVFTILFGILVIILTSGASLLNHIFPSPVAEIISALIVTALFYPVKHFLEIVTDKIFFRKGYRLEQVLSELNHLFIHTYKLDDLLGGLLSYLLNVLKLQRGAIFLMNSPGVYTLRSSLGVQNPQNFIYESNPIIKHLKLQIKMESKHKVEIVEREEIKHEITDMDVSFVAKHDLEEVKKEIEALGFQVVIPIFSKEDLIGILFLGEKKSQDPFSTQDIQFLDIVSHEAAFSIENSLNIDRIIKLNELKSEFITVVSHQLRTPLSVARWNTELILSGVHGKITNKKIYSAIGATYDSINKMNDGLNDLITSLGITEGKIILQKKKTDFVKEIVDSVKKELQQKIKEKNLGIRIFFKEPLEFVFDSTKIRYVFRALFSNAILYSASDGEVNITIEKIGKKLRVVFDDGGIGISPENRQNIFGKFWRGEQARILSPDGLGLSLFISRAFVEAHQGKLWVENKTMPGARFIFEIPLDFSR